MALIEIPVDPNREAQRFEISLDGTLYTLRFYWTMRQEFWAMDILSEAGVPFIQGIKMEPDWLPLQRYQIEGFPPGDFIVVDTSGQGLPPARTEFGLDARVKLLYDEAN